jgi:hypothetical protein
LVSATPEGSRRLAGGKRVSAPPPDSRADRFTTLEGSRSCDGKRQWHDRVGTTRPLRGRKGRRTYPGVARLRRLPPANLRDPSGGERPVRAEPALGFFAHARPAASLRMTGGEGTCRAGGMAIGAPPAQVPRSTLGMTGVGCVVRWGCWWRWVSRSARPPMAGYKPTLRRSGGQRWECWWRRVSRPATHPGRAISPPSLDARDDRWGCWWRWFSRPAHPPVAGYKPTLLTRATLRTSFPGTPSPSAYRPTRGRCRRV